MDFDANLIEAIRIAIVRMAAEGRRKCVRFNGPPDF